MGSIIFISQCELNIQDSSVIFSCQFLLQDIQQKHPNVIIDTPSLQIMVNQYATHLLTSRRQADHFHSFNQKESGMKLTSYIKCSCGWSSEQKVMVYLHKVYYFLSIQSLSHQNQTATLIQTSWVLDETNVTCEG